MVRNHFYRNRRDRKEGRRKNDSLTQVEGRREETRMKHQLRISVSRMSGTSSPFIGRVRNKKGVTWGSIRSDPQVTMFLFLSGYRIRVLFWIGSRRNSFICYA